MVPVTHVANNATLARLRKPCDNPAGLTDGAVGGVVLRRVWVSLTLDNRSPAYRHFMIWMDHNGVLAGSKHMRPTDGNWATGTKGYAPPAGAAHNLRPMETLTITGLFGDVPMIVGWIDAGCPLAQTKDRSGPGLHVLKGEY